MTIADHLRAVLATVNDKAHATPETQETIERARRALERFDETGDDCEDDEPLPQFGPMTERQDSVARVFQGLYPAPVADQRAAFVQALQTGPVSAQDAQGATQLGGGQERPATGSVVRSTGCSEMEQVPE